MAEGVKTRGIDINLILNLDELMREIGLCNVIKQTFSVPFGPWGGKVGELFAEDYRLANNSFNHYLRVCLMCPKKRLKETVL
jgi:hypothetical protein